MTLEIRWSVIPFCSLLCRSIGKKLSSLLKNDDDEDWSDLGLEKIPTTASEMMGDQENDHEEISQAPKPPVVANNSIHKKRTSLPASIKENPELVVKAATEEAPEVKPDPTDFVKYASKIPGTSKLFKYSRI